jgi:hypothetical protein
LFSFFEEDPMTNPAAWLRQSDGQPLPGDLGMDGIPLQVRTRVIRDVVVLEPVGRLSDAVQELDRAIRLALAQGPRGVVCDLSAELEGSEQSVVEELAKVGRHARDWPGIPVVVASPEARVREAVAAHPLGRHLVLAESLFSAVKLVLAAPALAVERLRLAPHPTSPRAARDFVTRTLLDWRLGRVIPFASLVIRELVASSAANAGTDIDISVAWSQGALRLTVRDQGPALPGQDYAAPDLEGPAFNAVAALARTLGALRTADGGTVVRRCGGCGPSASHPPVSRTSSLTPEPWRDGRSAPVSADARPPSCPSGSPFIPLTTE